MVTEIRTRNLRSLVDTGLITIKPINLLVGKNSSGKSTFARIFPLLRQSVEELKKGPILWFGRFVDFGNIEVAMRRDSPDRFIEFEFGLDVKRDKYKESILFFHTMLDFFPSTNFPEYHANIKLRLAFDDKSAGTSPTMLEINLLENRFIIEYHIDHSVRSVRINEDEWIPPQGLRCEVKQLKLLPSFTTYRQRKTTSTSTQMAWVEYNELLSNYLDQIKSYVHGNVKDSTIRNIASQILLGSDSDLIDSLKNINNAPQSWYSDDNIKKITGRDFKTIKNKAFAASLQKIIFDLDTRISDFFSGVRYVGPTRATAERYYRRQELAINEIDSKGANLVMFIDGLSNFQKSRLDDWMNENFGFSVLTEPEGGHLKLSIKHVGKTDTVNLADTGFGYSQIIPVAVQLWWMTNDINKAPPILQPSRCLVIEQPELHLHPEYQARLGNVFCAAVNAASSSKLNFSILAETHSAELINQIGRLVYKGTIAQKDVQIILFDSTSESQETRIQIANFDAEGVLTNWPTGFFDVGDL